MINFKKVLPIVISILLLGSISAFAQRGYRYGGGWHGHGRAAYKNGRFMRGPVVVVNPSPFRPAKIVVYHPFWGPNFYFNRRWVFFPKYNIYWDNWRNHYVFWNGNIWFSQPTPPPVIVNVNLANQKHYELKNTDDDTDDIYKANDTHKTEYKPE